MTQIEARDGQNADALAMCIGILQPMDPASELLYADEVNGFPHEEPSDYAWNIQIGLNRNRFDWAGRELGRALISGLNIRPSIEVLMGHEVGARVVFGACRKMLEARGIGEAELWDMYQSADAVHMRDFRAWFNGLPEEMTFDEFIGSLAS